ncbi:MAG: accessory gene regulator B family protein [Bacilli bacterium]|nr:accessory gene regulator B family protein [Bacilli bacterium]
MKTRFVNKCMEIIQSYNKNLSQIEIDKMRYGLEGLYLNITKIIFILIISILLRIFKETVLLLLIFNGIRFTAFGVHARRSIDCLISSSLFFIGFPLLCIYLTIPITIKYILFIPIVILIGIYAPSDTVKRPLKNKKKRIVFKILSILISIIYMILSIIIKDNTLSNCFLFALVIQVIVILPITYKIFGVPYNNHKNETN